MIADSDSTSRTSDSLLLSTLLKVTAPDSAIDNVVNKELRSGPRFPGDKFFTEWFRNKGSIYSFVFKKNHRVTNIQVAELIALIRSYRRDSGRDLSFLSVEGFNRVLAQIAESFRDDNAEGLSKYHVVVSKYADLINNTAVIDVMYGSCVVFLPPYVHVDLRAICSRSGYVHSCGRNVYIRNIYKARKSEMFNNIKAHIANNFPPGTRLLFRPYSHEDFTDHDRLQINDLRFGLDDVKLPVQKSFLQGDRLADVIEEMRSHFENVLVIPHPGDYREDEPLIKHERKQSGFESGHCLFLIMDHSIDKMSFRRGNRHFIICYDQECINENPFHLFDENKPAWFDHTTLPHTLAGAMINITRPYWPKKDEAISLCDCFVGSGTTLLEATKFNHVECCGSDYEPISQLLIKDNLLFFAASASDLREYNSSLGKISKHLHSPEESSAAKSSWKASREGLAFQMSGTAFDHWVERGGGAPESSTALVNELSSMNDPLSRLVFYTRLKVARRYEAALRSNTVDGSKMLERELVDLHKAFERLISLRERMESGSVEGHLCLFQGSYSQGVSIDRLYLERLQDILPQKVSVGDCREWKPESLYDLIVTDPPYGFNTDENPAILADIYASFLRTAIEHLSDNGQLVLALPDWSHTGRQLPAFILKDFVTHQVLVIAEDQSREVIHSAAQIPQTVSSPPYYWESEKALKRVILHFRFRERVGYRRRVSLVSDLDSGANRM